MNDGPVKKVTRFAIGVEGGFDANAGDFDIETEEHYQVVVIPGFHAIPFPNENLPEMVLLLALPFYYHLMLLLCDAHVVL